MMNDLRRIADQWRANADRAAFAHRFAAKYWGSANLWLGIPLIVVTVATGFLSVASFYQQSPWVGGGSLFLSFVAAVLAGLQTFLKPTERANQHWQAATRYAAARRAVELIDPLSPQARHSLDGIRKELDRLGENSPLVPEHIYRRSLELTPSPPPNTPLQSTSGTGDRADSRGS